LYSSVAQGDTGNCNITFILTTLKAHTIFFT